MKKEQERLKRALEVSLEQEWRTIPEESEIWKMHRFSPEFLEKMKKLQEGREDETKKQKKRDFIWMKNLAIAASLLLILFGVGATIGQLGRGSTSGMRQEEKAAELAPAESEVTGGGMQNDGAVMETQAAADSWLGLDEFFHAPDGVRMRKLPEDEREDAGYLLTGETQEKMKEILTSAELTKTDQTMRTEEKEQTASQSLELRIKEAYLEIRPDGVYLTGEDGVRHVAAVNGEGGAEAFWQKMLDFYQEIAASQESETESGS